MPVQAEWEAERSGHLTEGCADPVNSQMGFQGEQEATGEINERHGSQRSERGAVQRQSDARPEPGQLTETELQSPESQEEHEDLAGDMVEASGTPEAHSQMGFQSERGAVQRQSDARPEPGQLTETELQSQEEHEDLSDDMVEPSPEPGQLDEPGLESPVNQEVENRHDAPHAEVFEAAGSEQEHRFIPSRLSKSSGSEVISNFWAPHPLVYRCWSVPVVHVAAIVLSSLSSQVSCPSLSSPLQLLRHPMPPHDMSQHIMPCRDRLQSTHDRFYVCPLVVAPRRVSSFIILASHLSSGDVMTPDSSIS